MSPLDTKTFMGCVKIQRKTEDVCGIKKDRFWASWKEQDAANKAPVKCAYASASFDPDLPQSAVELILNNTLREIKNRMGKRGVPVSIDP